MKNFNYNIPTRVHFGKGQISALAKEIAKYNTILVTYGGGSIKHNGIYNAAIDIIKLAGKHYVELFDIQPNPRISSVRKGIELCREHKVDFILAIGGGSVIDCSKAIAFGYYHAGDPWDFFVGKAKVTNALPLGTILTFAATGTEMNPYCVISNEETQEKYGSGSPLVYPQFSILDPEYTFSVSPIQSAAGIADIMSHVFEQYFCSVHDTQIQDRMCEAILRTVIEAAPKVMANPADYEARANIMWASSLALNGMLSCGKIGDWAVHGIEHEISAIYDLTHGIGLAILHPNWMKYVLDDDNTWKFAEYGINVWNIDRNKPQQDIAEESIRCTRAFFNSLGLPEKLSEVNIDSSNFNLMATKATSVYKDNLMGMFHKLSKEDVEAIYKLAE